MNKTIQTKLNTFFFQFKEQKYKKGEILIRADDNPSGVFYLTEGTVKMYAISKRGDELIMNTFKPLSFFPMSWAINDTKNIYYYEAVVPVTAWKAPKEQIVNFIKSQPDVLYNLLSRMYKGTDGLLLRMNSLMAGSAYSRLITEILIQTKRFGEPCTAKDLEEKPFDYSKAVKLHISEKELASSAGMTRETISREMKKLKDKSLVSFSKNTLVIYNLNTLEAEQGNY